jgi:hypothetical protein
LKELKYFVLFKDFLNEPFQETVAQPFLLRHVLCQTVHRTKNQRNPRENVARPSFKIQGLEEQYIVNIFKLLQVAYLFLSYEDLNRLKPN